MAFLSCNADIAIYGGGAGSGKSYAMLLDPLRHCGIRGFDGVIFRRTTPEITNPGALWDEAGSIYPNVGATPRYGSLEWNWPAGATIAFRHMEHESDKLRYQGPSFAFIGFDELTHFTETQFWYLLSRNRSTCGVKPYIRATCNPDAESWVAEFLTWWIDQETGYAIPERSGKLRWVQRREGVLHWHDSREESIEAARLAGVRDEDNLPKSVTFIAASLEDNPALTSKDPGYRAGLLAMPLVDQERLLRGNWKIRAREGCEWGDECFLALYDDPWPNAFEMSAITIDPTQGSPDGDYCAIVFTGLSGGKFYVDAHLQKGLSAARVALSTIEMFLRHGADVVGLESNMNQATAIGPLIQQAAEDAGLPPLPLQTYEHKGKLDNKELRIFRLGPYMHGQRFRFRPTDGCRLLENQLRSFPLRGQGIHDDGPDALECGVRIINQRLRRMMRDEAEYTITTG